MAQILIRSRNRTHDDHAVSCRRLLKQPRLHVGSRTANQQQQQDQDRKT